VITGADVESNGTPAKAAAVPVPAASTTAIGLAVGDACTLLLLFFFGVAGGGVDALKVHALRDNASRTRIISPNFLLMFFFSSRSADKI
jgi:hypothetical protein